MVIYKSTLGYFYTCTCNRTNLMRSDKSRNVLLKCNDSFCIGCIAQLRRTGKFRSIDDEISIKPILEFKYAEDYDTCSRLYFKVECPRCLSLTEIGK